MQAGLGVALRKLIPAMNFCRHERAAWLPRVELDESLVR